MTAPRKAPAMDQRLLNLHIMAVLHDEKKVALQLRSTYPSAFPQREGRVEFCEISELRGSEKMDVAAWQPRGEVKALGFASGVATLVLHTYGPGNTWAEQWEIECAAVRTEARLLAWPTLRAALRWIALQWFFWGVALVLLAGLVAHLAHWK